MGGQERALKSGVDIIVATPGRLIDHMRQQNADLDRLAVDGCGRLRREHGSRVSADVDRLVETMTKHTLLAWTVLVCARLAMHMHSSVAAEEENPELVQTAPHTTRRQRLDETTAARKPILRWKGPPAGTELVPESAAKEW